MMTPAAWILGAVFCLLGTVALVAVAFVAARWFLDQGHRPTEDTVSVHRGPTAERLD